MVGEGNIYVSSKEQDRIQVIFENNASYFSKNDKHHTKYIEELIKAYNEHLGGVTIPFSTEDKNCEDCQTTIIKLWSTIIYDIWGKKII